MTRYLDLKRVNDTGEFARHSLDAEFFISEDEIKEQLDTYLKLQSTWLVFAIITGTLLGILLLIVLFLRSRLFIAVALIKQGAKYCPNIILNVHVFVTSKQIRAKSISIFRAVSDMTFTLAWPIFPWIAQLAVILWFLLVGLYLATASEPVYRVTKNCTCSETISFVENEK